MAVAVTGATGFVGRHVVRELVSRGITVRALVRDRGKAEDVLPEEGVELVTGDVHDGTVLDVLMHGAQAVVHTIGIRRELPENITFERMHVRATGVVLEAARRAGIRRHVQVSALGVRDNAPTRYQQSKYDAERLVQKSGLAWTIVRPALIHGAEGEFVQMVRDWVLGRAAPYFALPYFCRVEMREGFPPRPRLTSAKVAPVDVRDVARTIVEALSSDDAEGEIYAMCGSDVLEWPEMLRELEGAVQLRGKPKPVLPVPGRVGAANARLARVFGLSAALPFGESEPVLAMEDSVCGNGKLEAHLGITPRGFHDALSDYAGTI